MRRADKIQLFVYILSIVLVFGGVAGAVLEERPGVSIRSPRTSAVVSGSGVEIEVAYHTNSGQPIVKVEVHINGKFAFGGPLVTPEMSGSKLFIWDTTPYPDGKYFIGATAVDAGENEGSVSISVKVANAPTIPGEALSIAIVSPEEGEVVRGVVDVEVEARKGDIRWVNYFIDGKFWAMRNYPPFVEYWDTEEYSEGEHSLGVTGYGPGEQTSSATVTVIVKNEGEVAPEEEVAPAEELEEVTMEPMGPEIPPPALGTALFAEEEMELEEPELPAELPELVVEAPIEPEVEVRAVPEAPAVPEIELAGGPEEEIVEVEEEYEVVPPQPLPPLPMKRTVLYYGTERVKFPDAQPRVEPPGISLVPIRAVIEHLGGKVKWYHEEKRAEAAADGITIEIQIGSEEAKVNGEKVKMGSRAYIFKSRTMVPLRFLAEVLGLGVRYEVETRLTLKPPAR